MKRDHTKLIYDISEMSGLFADAPSLEKFLQNIVEVVAGHMHSAVCSVYLYFDDSKELILKATKGLKPEAVGKVRLKLGEGLTGLALKEMRPICEKNASKAPGYRYFPDIGEEPYESFLAIPIVRGQNRVGAVVIQNVQKDYFNDEDIKALKVITSQMANTIETAKLLMELERQRPFRLEQMPEKGLKFLKGKVGSEGFAFGKAVVLNNMLPAVVIEESASQVMCTVEDFHRAVQATEKQLDVLQQHVEEKLSDVASLIFTAQILMLKDKAFVGAVEDLIRDGLHPARAVCQTVENYVRLFEELPSTCFQEKKQDVQDIGRRLLRNLIGLAERIPDFADCIVIAQELFPSDILKLSSQRIKGLILLSGGVTSHLSILARSLGIPLIITGEKRLLRIPEGAQVLIDGEQGNIHIDPSEDIVRTYRKREEDKAALSGTGTETRPATYTRDGTRVRLLANINLLGDVAAARAVKAEGIGLYRTEFPFLVRSDFPSEEEQYIVYKRLTEAMAGQEITFRTLDIGGDKILSYYDYGKEENPFLGMRSIRFSLRHTDIFTAQLRAILRAGVGAELKIVFPMIASLDEFREARALVRQCMNELRREKIPHHHCPTIGVMVELPAVLEIIDDLAAEADFFSIGTNDFIQYMLAVDRTNEKVADIYLPHHPAVLRALNKVVTAARRRGIGVTVCGDMAHDRRYIPYLLGIGIRELSLDARRLSAIQTFIEGIDLRRAVETAQKLLRYNTVDIIEKVLDG